MRVLFVSWRDLAHADAGGSEIVVDQYANGLRELGHEVSLLCAGPVGQRPYPVVENGGAYSQYLRAPIQYLRRFRNVDVVVDVANGLPFFSPWWRRGPRLCLVHHVHGEQWFRYFPRPVAAIASRIESRVMPRVYRNTRFVAVSESTALELVETGVRPDQITVVPNGARIEAGPEIERAPEPMFLALGRLAANKRVDLLLDQWQKVAPRTGGKLVIAGDGPCREHVESRLLTEPGLANVIMEGRVSEQRKAELLSEAWLLVHTAEREGWGLVIVEAALCRTPTLAYCVPGVRDAIVNNVTGVMVDDDDAFVEEWVALTMDHDRRGQLGESGAVRAEEYRWDRSLDAFVATIERTIREHDSSSLECQGVR